MHPKKMANILGLPAVDRFTYFVSRVADFEELWSLYDQGWAKVADASGRQMVPFLAGRGIRQRLCLRLEKLSSCKAGFGGFSGQMDSPA
jgi:hypothetical protein